MKNIILPHLGEGIESVEVSEILISIGEKIKNNDPLILVESEKASMEIPSTEYGEVKNIYVTVGDTIKPGSTIISLINYDKTKVEKDKPSDGHNNKKKVKQSHNNDIEKDIINEKKILQNNSSKNIITYGESVIASPSVRKFARELGCDLKKVYGSGHKGRISKKDVEKYVKNILNQNNNSIFQLPKQEVDFSQWGNIEIVSLNKIKRLTGTKLQQAWQSIPHVTQFDSANITKLEKLRRDKKKKYNLKISIIPFIIKSLDLILKEMPIFNSSLDQTNNKLILKKYINIGIAVDTKDGLVVPVIQNITTKSIEQINTELINLSKKARAKKLMPQDMSGGSFTISSLGGIGGNYFTPIINAPEVAILGISKMENKLFLENNEYINKVILPFSLSYDHRVIDGADAARFTTKLSERLSNFDKLNNE